MQLCAHANLVEGTKQTAELYADLEVLLQASACRYTRILVYLRSKLLVR